jgi:hypothetical protein
VSSFGEKALEADEALETIRGIDKRPLIIIREAAKDADLGPKDKKASDLLTAAMKSENLKLASYWFHCVKVDARVTEEGHPFHSLFAGKNPPRMILSSWDGKVQHTFLGTSKQKIKWDKIVKVLKVEYKRDPKKAVKELYTVLSKYDFIDSKEKELLSQMDRAKDKRKKSRIKTLEKKLAELKNDRAEIEKREQKLRELILLRELEEKKAKTIG